MTNGREMSLRRCLNIASDGAYVTYGVRLFQKVAPETGKAHLPMVERLNNLNCSTASWLVKVDQSLPGRHVSDTGEV